MKIKVKKGHLLEGLQRVQAVIPSRTTLPVLSNVLLRTDAGKLWLTASDLDVSVRTSVTAEIEQEGGTTLPGRRCLGIVRELPDPEITLAVDEHDVVSLECGASFFKVLGISEEDFPPLPVFEGEHEYTLDCGVFREMLQKTSYASSNDETRPVLNGILLSFQEEKLTVVATDGRRLALVEQEVEFPRDAARDIVLPSKTVQELIRTLGGEGLLRVKAVKNQVAFEFGDMLIVSKLIEGTYPNFRQVIPPQSETRVAIERELLLESVKRVALMTSDEAASVKLILMKNRMEISTESPDIGAANESLPLKYDGERIVVAFNPDFLMDPLRALQSDEILMEVTDELSPSVIKCEVPFLYVLMPIRTV